MPAGNINLKFNLISAFADNMGMGFKMKLPWHLKKEMAYFQRMTTGTKDPNKKNVVIMGRRTWESVPVKQRPFKGRINIVLSKSISDVGNPNVPVCKTLQDVVSLLTQAPFADKVETIWIIGGSRVYEEAMNSPHCYRLYITRIQGEFEADTFFPPIPSRFHEISDENIPKEIQEENGIKYRYTVLEATS